MDSETVALVERCFAEGKVERPDNGSENLVWYKRWSDWAWVYGNPDSIHKAEPADDVEAVIGWALTRACWANGWVQQQDEDGSWRVAGRFASGKGTVYALRIGSGPDPIRAMAEALLA